jgi:cytochrome P450
MTPRTLWELIDGHDLSGFDHHDDVVRGEVIYDLWRSAHEGPRVQRSEEHGGFWILTRFDDVVAAARDTATFSSAAGVFLPPLSPLSAALEQDPPIHAEYRRLFMYFLTRSRIDQIQPFIAGRALDLVGALARSGGGDFVSAVGEKLPVEVVAASMGLSGTIARRLRELTVQMWEEREETAASSEGGFTDPRPVFEQMLDLFRQELQDRRRHPREDFLGFLINARVTGRRLDDDKMANILLGLAVAGHETTVNAASSMVIDLADEPELQHRLTRERNLVPQFVLESLRHRTPVQWFFRTVTREVQIEDAVLAAGDRVMLAWGGANRDGRQFPEPDHFRVDRSSAGKHLSFGSGPHRCVGAPLAQAELEAIANALLDAGEFTLKGPVEWRIHGSVHFGAAAVPVAFG